MSSVFNGKNIILAVTGSIAAYKAAQLCSLLKKKGSEIYPVMTPDAANFIGPLTLSSIAGNKTIISQYEQGEKIYHISLAHSADAMVIAPASANTISKLACGICDNFLTTTAISARCPVLMAPAMNQSMYLEKSVQKNIEDLKSSGKYFFIGPLQGRLACGEKGTGKMADPAIIAEEIGFLLHYSNQLKGKKVLVTAGGTREYIDPVRFISNLSSGKMGAALAEEAELRGAEKVVLVTAGQDTVSGKVKGVYVQTSAQMKEKILEVFDDMDIIIMAAAVSDIVPEKTYDYKLKKKDDILSKISFRINENILKLLAEKKEKGQLLIGFAAEYGPDMKNVSERISGKNIDAVIANDISRPDIGMGSDYNQVTIVTRQGKEIELKKAKKRLIARQIWDQLIEIFMDKQKS
ncbi:MAG: bifunctional phosphopantothenoylcysteine decarboxylase/phosphopantothenate--cysteine ligase CoaBC [Actinomycetota bacterium]